MAYHTQQFRELIQDVLTEVNLWSKSAENLLLGTAAQESRFGTYLRQLGRGPALGAFQIEPETFADLKARYHTKYPWAENYEFEQLRWDLKASILFCRLKYLSVKEPLPDANNVQALARYWKKYYNTYLGKGTPEEFILNYQKYVGMS